MPINFSTYPSDSGGGSNSNNNNSSSGGSGLLSKIKNKVQDAMGGSGGFNKNSTNVGDPGTPTSMAKGGKVKKTGLIKMHKGEKVLTKRQTKKYEARKRA